MNDGQIYHLNPTYSKLERFELFSTQQAYFIVACDHTHNAYRVLKIDRTLITSNTSPQLQQQQQQQGDGASMNNNTNANGNNSNNNGDSSNVKRVQDNDDRITSDGDSQNHQQTARNSAVDSNSGAQSQHVNYNHQNQDTASIAPALGGPHPNTKYNPLSAFCIEDPHVYSQEEISDMLDMVHDGNKHAGGLVAICKAHGIVGFIRFLDCYYLTLITRRAKVGSIGECAIYSVKSTEMFPMKPAELHMIGEDTSNPRNSSSGMNNNINNASGNQYTVPQTTSNDPSSMLLSLWNQGKRSVGLGLTNREIAELRYQGLYQVFDLSKNFFFSYSYDLTRTLQDNFLFMQSNMFPPPPSKDMYSWNHFLTRELEECTSPITSSFWILPLVHGAFVQRKVIDYGRSLNLILLARRSRHFAGTRYLKRGVSDRGKVANDVEHEQIIHDETFSGARGVFCSFTQVRGSIPIYWTQESSVTMPKPPIILNRIDPTYKATQAHFEDLFKRYGSPVVVCDLVKQSEKRDREVIVGNEYRHAIEYLNTYIDDKYKIRYCALDYAHYNRHRLNVKPSLDQVSIWSVNQTGFFCNAPRWKIIEDGSIKPFTEEDGNRAKTLSQKLGVPVFSMEQKGVLRTNWYVEF